MSLASASSGSSISSSIIKNLCILDAVSGVVVFKHLYSWPAQTTTSSSKSLGSLIQSFYQFAREIDDGELVSVHFEGVSRRPSRRRSLARFSKRKDVDTMQMVCARSDEIVVSVFFDPKDLRGTSHTSHPVGQEDQRLRDFAEAILAAFETECGEAVRALRRAEREGGGQDVLIGQTRALECTDVVGGDGATSRKKDRDRDGIAEGGDGDSVISGLKHFAATANAIRMAAFPDSDIPLRTALAVQEIVSVTDGVEEESQQQEEHELPLLPQTPLQTPLQSNSSVDILIPPPAILK